MSSRKPQATTVHPAIPRGCAKRLCKFPRDGRPQTLTSPMNAPQLSLQIYDTTLQAADPDHLKILAETFHKETREIDGRDQRNRIDVWGMPFAADASEEERIAKCKAHILAEITTRETSGEHDFHVPGLCSHYQCNRAILIIDQPEKYWNEGEGGVLAVYWDLHPSYLEMLEQAYGENYQDPETSAFRHTREELGQLLGD